jgi:hypothetical protein
VTLEEELRGIWAKYAPQLAAEREAQQVQATAERELAALNLKRAQQGLELVGAYRQGLLAQMGVNQWQGPPAKTWRDERDGELLSAIRKHLT